MKTEQLIPNSQPFFLIIGRHRSGTTLLRVIFDSHPGINMCTEHPFVTMLYKKYHRTTKWDKIRTRSFLKDLLGLPMIHILNIDEDILSNKLNQISYDSSYGDVCMAVYASCRPFQKKENISLLASKNIPFTIQIPQLRKIFPGVKFIHISRDYRDNILSMKRVRFEARVTATLAYRWKYFQRKALQAFRQNDKDLFLLRYEDFVAEPEKYVRDLCQFIGIDFRPCMMDFYNKKDEYRQFSDLEQATRKEHRSLFHPISTAGVSQWKQNMSPWQILIADAVVGNTAELFGYTRVYKRGLFFIQVLYAPLIFYGWALFPVRRFVQFLPLHVKMGLFRILTFIFKPAWHKRKLRTPDVD